MLVGGKLLDIVTAKGKVCTDKAVAVFIKRDDLNQAVCGNGSSACRYKLLGSE